MRSCLKAGLVIIGLACLGGQASADVRITVRNESYTIRGKSGIELLESMQKRGPRHGLLARAIAQTAYQVGWSLDFAYDRGACRVKTADAELTIRYIYPKTTDALSPAVKRRWQRFMKGVVRHEEQHGKLAGDMVKAARKAVLKVATTGDKSCSRTKAAVKTKVKQVYAAYEARQIAFDAKEHDEGGRVDRLVIDLVD